MQRVQVQLVDDLNDEEAQETVRFGFEGTKYEIDLTTENAEKLRSVLAEYAEKGRKVSGGKRSQGGAKSSSRNKREDTQQIRQWAQGNGYNPNSRGRITQTIIDAYNEANN
ncbi:histone-like nucleoid-structuring protein Lsr2 [Arthrobacter sp. TMS1-12-1]